MNGGSRDPETSAIIGAAVEVHRVLGPGFLEAVYQEALAVELSARSVPYQREVRLPISYKGVPLGLRYCADFVCHGSVIVELKALRALSPIEEAQVLNYLKATRLSRALLLNFRSDRLTIKRFIDSHTL